MDAFVQKVFNTIRRYQLVDEGDLVYVALSGGADSVALLYVMCCLQKELRVREVRALHVNHGLRGAESDEDTRFVREICSKLNVSLAVAYADVALEAEKAREGIEEAGRRIRYNFFESAVKGENNVKIATAHTVDDCAETILLNLARGCSLRGLGGIPVKRDCVIRPLYDCTANEVRVFCKENGYAFRLDSSNNDVVYSRNRIRHEVIPQLKIINARAVCNLVRTAKVARDEDEYMHSVATALVEQADNGGGTYCAATLKTASAVVRRRALRMIAEQNGCDYVEFRHVDALEAIVSAGEGTANLPNRVTASVRECRLTVTAPASIQLAEPIAVSVSPNQKIDFNGKSYYVTIISNEEFQNGLKVHKNLFNFCISYDMIKGGLVLRTRRTGDYIHPYNRSCGKSVKKLMNELKIPLGERDFVPLLCDDDGVLAVLGTVVDERAAVQNTTTRMLCLRPLGNNESTTP